MMLHSLPIPDPFWQIVVPIVLGLVAGALVLLVFPCRSR